MSKLQKIDGQKPSLWERFCKLVGSDDDPVVDPQPEEVSSPKDPYIPALPTVHHRPGPDEMIEFRPWSELNPQEFPPLPEDIKLVEPKQPPVAEGLSDPCYDRTPDAVVHRDQQLERIMNDEPVVLVDKAPHAVDVAFQARLAAMAKVVRHQIEVSEQQTSELLKVKKELADLYVQWGGHRYDTQFW